MMSEEENRPVRPWLLVSDVDGTLTGDVSGLLLLRDALAVSRHRLWFALNSSRPRASIARTVQQEFPPGLVPDAAITALGTEILVDGRPLETWQRRFHGWPQQRIFDLLKSHGHRPHDAEFQTPWKVSFAVPEGAAQDDLRAELARLQLPAVIVASGTDDFDIIPPGAGKAAAALYLARTLGNSPDTIIAAGDSGNDLDVFRIAARAIAVANSRNELLAMMPAGTTYVAKEPFAAGVLEGLVHFGVIP
jgi:sucrose-phosphate synthase